jgi:uncharacterized RDD family membrane protein YckC
MDRLAIRRVGAWALDWIIISLYAGALVPLGLLLDARGVRLPTPGWNAVAFVLLIAPATLWLAAWERAGAAASPGKRRLGLRVIADGRSTLGWPRALLRNGLKVALPWELGHTAAFILADPGTEQGGPLAVTGMACGVVACVLAGTYVLSLWIGSGRTPYDRAAGTRVGRSGATD